MTVTVRAIIPAQQIPAVQTVLYTATGCKTIVDKFTVTNTGGTNVGLIVYLTPPGISASVANMIIKSRTILPSETYLCPEMVGQSLESGGGIVVQASTAAVLTLSASGREIT